MKALPFMMIAVLVLLTSACTNTFLVYKEGKGAFLGSKSDRAYDMLCKSGDLKKVLASTHLLSDELKDTLYTYHCDCAAGRACDKVRQLYVSMTLEQRKDIRSAFRANGYDINRMAC